MRAVSYNHKRLPPARYGITVAHVVFSQLTTATAEQIDAFNANVLIGHYDKAEATRSDSDRQFFKHCLDFCMLEVPPATKVHNVVCDTRSVAMAYNTKMELVDTNSRTFHIPETLRCSSTAVRREQLSASLSRRALRSTIERALLSPPTAAIDPLRWEATMVVCTCVTSRIDTTGYTLHSTAAAR